MISSLKGISLFTLFTSDGEDVWEVETMCSEPTITLKNLRTGKREHGAVGCLNFEKYDQLARGERVTATEAGAVMSAFRPADLYR